MHHTHLVISHRGEGWALELDVWLSGKPQYQQVTGKHEYPQELEALFTHLCSLNHKQLRQFINKNRRYTQHQYKPHSIYKQHWSGGQ